MNQLMLSLLASTGEGGGSSSSNLWYFLVAYLLLWAVIFGYLLFLHRRMNRLERSFEEEDGEREQDLENGRDDPGT